ncbi:MAG: hypothetical protein NC416_08750 [Eubacterium sp.]|nr:hypothetical protein [Eubacterium sp.]
MIRKMKNMIVKKGSYGYIENHKAVTALRTLLFFVVSVGLYLMGYLTTGTSKNLLTIVAVLGCLPACKSMVNFILFLKAKGCSKALKDKVSVYDDQLTTFYDMYFTSYQKNYPISHMVLKGNVLCGIAEMPKCDCNEAEKHLEQMLRQEGIKNMTVKIFSQTDKYLDRLSQLMISEAEEHKNRQGIINLLYSISI